MKLAKSIRLAALAACALTLQTASADYFVRWEVTGSGYAFYEAGLYMTGPGASGLQADAELLRDLGVESFTTLANDDHLTAPETTSQVRGLPASPETSEYNFEIRLFDDASNLIAASDDVLTLQGLIDGKFAQTALNDQTGYSVWQVCSFHAVPEPTSGILFLLGLASLALHRKKV